MLISVAASPFRTTIDVKGSEPFRTASGHMVLDHRNVQYTAIYQTTYRWEYPPARRTRVVALIGVAHGLLFQSQAVMLQDAHMSAITNSGRSVHPKFEGMTVCFWPETDGSDR